MLSASVRGSVAFLRLLLSLSLARLSLSGSCSSEKAEITVLDIECMPLPSVDRHGNLCHHACIHVSISIDVGRQAAGCRRAEHSHGV
jgi:hypothetical protein